MIQTRNIEVVRVERGYAITTSARLTPTTMPPKNGLWGAKILSGRRGSWVLLPVVYKEMSMMPWPILNCKKGFSVFSLQKENGL